MADKQYLKYLIESMAYSFDDDDAHQEEFAFNKSRIGDVAEFLHNAGPVEDDIWINADAYGKTTYWLDERNVEGPILSVLQSYKNFIFMNRFKILGIEYIQLVDGREFLEFDIEDITTMDENLIAYKITNDVFYYSNDKLYNDIKKCKPLWDTILDIINQIKNHG